MSGGDVIVTLGDDVASERGMSGYVDTVVIVQNAVLLCDASFVFQGSGDAFVPEFLLLCNGLDLLMSLGGGGHNECPEVLQGEDCDVSVVVFSLVMIASSAEEVCFDVGGAGLMLENEMVFS
ncbi:uncharacterized protein ARMOST_07712 [Armillaria ostoyae]|uniref:Uncharacterized protein n=1 Tax=Armillaria ostoyae TaxID=47428 RepID=A0A284R6K3_ARMOS|nr:uncharacterized protein ARMOST_07712 [Armillaria ostoyae]